MEAKFWQDAWRNGETAFTQNKPNYILTHNFDALNTPKNGRVFVPLCGKSIDMVWFTEQEYDVIGIELIESAVVEFFDEHNINTTITPHPTKATLKNYHGNHNGKNIHIWVGDIFELDPVDIGKVDSIYDRGALIAMPDVAPDFLRTRYTQQVIKLSDCADQFLLSFAYEDNSRIAEEKPGDTPPFLITDQKLNQYYAKYYDIKVLVKEKADVVSAAGNSGYRLAYGLFAK